MSEPRGRETCPNGCDLAYYGTHQGLPDCDREPRDPEWYEPSHPDAARQAPHERGEG